MKTVGIIAEYNPFHNGHRYQMEQARQRTEADYVIIAMSGDFVQRGEPAVYNKYIRTASALNAGADLVLELPSYFATSSAEDFAACGVALLHKTGVTDVLCFGSEAGDIEPLSAMAALLLEEPENYSKSLKRHLAGGHPFPKARYMAATDYLQGTAPEQAEMADLLNLPNNILGIEYIKALMQRKSHMRPLTIRREGMGYHDTRISEGQDFPSASAIRKAISQGDLGFSQPGQVPIFANDLTAILNMRILSLFCQPPSGGRLSEESPDISYADLSPELLSRLGRHALDFTTFDGRILQLKTKQYTYTRISRALLHLILDIRTEDIAGAKDLDYCPYARILGFRKSAEPLLHQMKHHTSIPIITKTANARKILSPQAYELFQKDLHASHLYQSLVCAKSGLLLKNEYTQSVLTL